MTDASNLPLALYKANLELWLQLGQLLKDNREQWMGLLTQELEQRMSEARHAPAPGGSDWPAMTMLPGSELWRIAEQQVSDVQALAQTASGNQMTFVNGFQQALDEWRQATAAAFGEAAGEVELPAQPFQSLHDTFEQLSNALLSGMTALAPTAAPAGSAGTGARQPAAPPEAPVRKAPKAAKRPARKAARKTGSRAAGPATKKAVKKATRAPVRKAAKKAAKKTARKVAKKAPKKAAKRAARKTAR